MIQLSAWCKYMYEQSTNHISLTIGLSLDVLHAQDVFLPIPVLLVPCLQLTIITHENFYGSIWDSCFDSFEEFLIAVDVFCVSDCPSNWLS